MTDFEILPGTVNDVPRLTMLDHSSLSDYVWQLELRREAGQASANFREVRLPRSIEVKYTRASLMYEAWTRREWCCGVAGCSNGYLCHGATSTDLAWVTDIVVASHQDAGAGSPF